MKGTCGKFYNTFCNLVSISNRVLGGPGYNTVVEFMCSVSVKLLLYKAAREVINLYMEWGILETILEAETPMASQHRRRPQSSPN